MSSPKYALWSFKLNILTQINKTRYTSKPRRIPLLAELDLEIKGV